MPVAARSSLLLGLALAFLPIASQAKAKKPEAPNGAVAFEKLKSLAGTWRGHSEKAGDAVAVTYRVAAGGTILIETLFPGTAGELLSIYFLDGSDLMLTHYSSAGNQPEMVYDHKRSTPEEFVFKFLGGRGFVAREDFHLHNGTIRFVDASHVEVAWTGWTYGRESGTRRFVLTHQP